MTVPAPTDLQAFDDRTAPETRQLLEWAALTTFDDLPEDVVRTSRQLIIDHLGVTIGGTEHDASRIALDLVRELGGAGRSTIIGHGDRTSAPNAALVNGISSHVLDFDDTHIPTILHPTGPILAASLAVGQQLGVSGRDLIRAHVIAVEVAARASNAIFPEHYDAGWHMSGTTGTLAAAAGAALIAGMTGPQLVMALGIAATQASGQREQFGAMTKSLHVGKAASNGVLSAALARRGFTAAPDSLQGRRGMFAVMSGASRPEALIRGLGQEWEIGLVGVKPYACGVVAHPPIDAVRRLRTERGIDAGDIVRVELQVNPLVVELTGKREPRTGLEGKFSVVHGAAIAMIDGGAGPRQFTNEAVLRPEVMALRDRIDLHADDAIGHSQAVAVARLRDGSEVRVDVRAARGTPENPLSPAELEAKFRDLAEPVLGGRRASEIVDRVTALEAEPSLDRLLEATVRDREAGRTAQRAAE